MWPHDNLGTTEESRDCSSLKYTYEYKYLWFKYEYKYKYLDLVLEYNSSTVRVPSTSTTTLELTDIKNPVRWSVTSFWNDKKQTNNMCVGPYLCIVWLNIYLSLHICALLLINRNNRPPVQILPYISQ